MHGSDRSGFVHIAPQHHLAAITDGGGAGVNLAVRAEEDRSGLVQVAAALPAAAHPYRAAACSTFSLYPCVAVQGDVITFQLNTTTHVAAAVGTQHRVADDQLGRCGLAGCAWVHG